LYLRLSLLAALMWAVPACLVPMYSVALENLGFDKLTIALCCSTQAVAAVFASLFAGQVADRWLSAERALSVCALLAGVALWCLAGLHEPAAVFVVTLGFWMLCGPITLLGTTVCFTHLPLPAKQFGPVRMWGTVAWITVGWLGGLWLWVRQTPPADVFRMGSFVAWLLSAYALTLPPTPPRPGRGFAPLAALRLFRDRGFAVYTACLFGASLTFPFTTQLTPLLLGQLGVTREWLTPTLTVAQPLEVAGLFVLPGILAALGLRRTMLVGLCAWLAAMLVLSVGRPLELVVPSMVLNGLYIVCFTVAGQVYVNGLAEGDLKASVQGLFNCVNGLGLLLGNLLAGALRHLAGDHLPTAFAVAAGITGVMVVVFALGFERREVYHEDPSPKEITPAAERS
jgi:predicted MFS family arabinose efflux permease